MICSPCIIVSQTESKYKRTARAPSDQNMYFYKIHYVTKMDIGSEIWSGVLPGIPGRGTVIEYRSGIPV